MTDATRAFARSTHRREIDFWTSLQLKQYINEQLEVFRGVFSKAEFGIIVAAFQKKVHVAANDPNSTHNIRDIDEAKAYASRLIDIWATTRLPELKALKVEVDGEGKVNIGVEIDPNTNQTMVYTDDGKPIRLGSIAVTAVKPSNPWE